MRSRTAFGVLTILTLCLTACDSGSPTQSNSPMNEDMHVPHDGHASDVSIADSTPPEPDMNPMVEADAAPPEEEITGPYFERDHLLRIDIDMHADDWDAMRFQGRDFGDIMGPGCMDQPFPSPFTWFQATVTVDGERYVRVGIRKKGFFGSLSDTKPSLKLKFDKYVDDQTHYGYERMTLNNSRQDPSYVKQCMAYDLFAEAGIPAPRCNFASVHLNGEPMGVFVHVEAMKKDFLRQHFDDEDGNLYEGTLSDFREGWTGTFDQKTNEDNVDMEIIDRITAVLTGPNLGLLDALDQYMDLDQFFTFWAMETLVAHWDGYAGNTNNFYIYQDPDDDRLRFIPWGVDGTFNEPRRLFEDALAPRSINANGLLARRLYLHPQGQERYLQRLQDLLDTHWDVDALTQRMYDMTQIFQSEVPFSRLRELTASLERISDFIAEQPELIQEEIQEGPVEWTAQLRGSICGRQIGEAGGRLQTTWGSWPTDDALNVGNAEVSVRFRDGPAPVAQAGGAVGINEEDPSQALVIMPFTLRGGGLLFFRFAMPLDAMASGRRYDLAEDTVNGALIFFDAERNRFQMVGSFSGGQLHIIQGSTNDGAPIELEFSAQLWGRG